MWAGPTHISSPALAPVVCSACIRKLKKEKGLRQFVAALSQDKPLAVFYHYARTMELLFDALAVLVEHLNLIHIDHVVAVVRVVTIITVFT